MQIEELLAKFKLDKVLKSDPLLKSIVLLGVIDEEWAIVTIEKSMFDADKGSKMELSKSIDEIKVLQNNDVYYWSLANLHQEIDDAPGAKMNVIYPATETHIKKFSTQKMHYVKETPELYSEVVKPYIETQRGDRIQWVHNILFHGKESETFIYHDEDPMNGFVLLPDMKWDRQAMEALYVMAIVKRTDIASVRDLRGSHVPFLENLNQKIKEVTSEKYGVDQDELRAFIHYQPSYYHFHVHLVRLTHPGLGNGINVGKAILLDDVIENLKLVPDYYEKRTLAYVLGENHDLWSKFQENA